MYFSTKPEINDCFKNTESMKEWSRNEWINKLSRNEWMNLKMLE